MKFKNPFPGMNPWLEDHWADVHVALISYIRDTLGTRLPPDLVAEAEEHISIAGNWEEETASARADVAVKEIWREGFSPQWSQDDADLASRAAEPLIVPAPPHTERWIEIHDFAGRLITVIEILSPTNKTGRGHSDYVRKQDALLGANVNLVEIDLLRGGRPTVAAALAQTKPLEETHYWISVRRAARPHVFELYRPKLRECLPVMGIPLRPRESDVYLDLQPLIDRTYETGRYWRLDYATQPSSALTTQDMAWARSLLEE